MFDKNSKNIFIIIIILILLFLFYYNQQTQQNKVFKSASNLNMIENKNKNLDSEKSEAEIVVHLAGAVKNEGVYKLTKKDRLVDLIKAAGGLKKNADLGKINLAKKLYDGQKFIIPEFNEGTDDFKANSNSQISEELFSEKQFSSDNNFININQAEQSELEKLSGIGPSKAAAIIKYREQNRNFTKKEDLLNISGIGEKTLENIKDEIVLR